MVTPFYARFLFLVYRHDHYYKPLSLQGLHRSAVVVSNMIHQHLHFKLYFAQLPNYSLTLRQQIPSETDSIVFLMTLESNYDLSCTFFNHFLLEYDAFDCQVMLLKMIGEYQKSHHILPAKLQ